MPASLYTKFRTVALLAAAALATGCSTIDSYAPTLRSFGVYKLDINQGNYISQDEVDKLRVGQTRQQVKLVLGTPLIESIFRNDRWDYSYLFIRQGRMVEQRNFTVYFVDDKVARWEGDEVPPPPAQVARAGGGDAVLDKSLTTAPKTSEDNWLSALLRKLGWWK